MIPSLVSGTVVLRDKPAASTDSCTEGNGRVKFDRSGESRDSVRVCPPVMIFLLESRGVEMDRRALLRSCSMLCLDPSSLDVLPSTATLWRERSGSACLNSALFLILSWLAHCTFSLARPDSAFCNSSLSSRTRRSWPAIATKKPLGSAGDAVASIGVGGNDAEVEEVGVGRVESLEFVPVATGKFRDRRFRRGVCDSERMCPGAGRGGGAIGK